MFPIPTLRQLEKAEKRGGFAASEKLLTDGFTKLRAQFNGGHMAFGKKFNGNFGGAKKGFKKGFTKKSNPFDNTNITGLWGTKRDGLWVGTANELDGIIALVKKAKADGQGITFFLWQNTKSDSPVFNLVANVARDNPNAIQSEDEPAAEEGEGLDGL